MQTKMKRLIGIMLACAMLASCSMLAFADETASDDSETPDYIGHWAEEYMQFFVEEGYLNGKGGNNYDPDGNITRAEMMALINRVAGYEEQADSSEVSVYTDVEESAWYYEDVAIALEAGYVNGSSSTTMSPARTMSREEAMTMIGRIVYGVDYTYSGEDVMGDYPDSDEVDDWAYDYVAALIADEVVNGKGDGTISPTDTITRAEVVKILYCLLDELNPEEEEYVYVLMNVPYSDFYSVLGDEDVDVVSSATGTKTRTVNQTMAGGAYHVNSDGSDITGITYSVYLPVSALEGLNEVTDETTVSYSVTNKGTTTEYEFTGEEALVEAESYSYYVLTEEPSCYLTAEVGEDGSIVFTGLVGESETIEGVTYEFYTDTYYGDYELDLDSDTVTGVLGEDGYVSAITLNTTDGSVYGLRHVENIWKGSELSWSTGHSTTERHGNTLAYENYVDLEGKTIESVTYYTTTGIYVLELDEECYVAPYAEDVTVELNEDGDIEIAGIPEDAEDVSITVSLDGTEVESSYDAEAGIVAAELAAGSTYTLTISSSNYSFESYSVEVPEEYVYVLMNVPYSDFYSVLGDEDVDVVSSATGTKTRTVSQTMAGGAYHVNSDGSDITGITYSVYLPASALEGLNEVTDETTVSYSVTNKGTTTDYEFTGEEALVEAESYSYYVLTEEPDYYLTAEVGEDGSLVFTGLVGESETIEGVTYEFYTDTYYGDYELDLDSDTVTGVLGEDGYVSAITLNTTDGSVYGLRHVENIWKGSELSWSTGHSTTERHGNTLAYENYADLEGKTIESVTYYTTTGIYVLELDEECYVAPYAEDVTVELNEDGDIEIAGIPEDAEDVAVAVSLDGTEVESSYDAETGIVAAELEAGTYTVTISSSNYSYKSYSVEVTE